MASLTVWGSGECRVLIFWYVCHHQFVNLQLRRKLGHFLQALGVLCILVLTRDEVPALMVGMFYQADIVVVLLYGSELLVLPSLWRQHGG